MRWRARPSSAAHWASKASSCGAGGSRWGRGWGTGKGTAQLSAPLKVALPLGAGGAGHMVDTLMKEPVPPTTGASCWGGVEAEPKTLATICEGVMPTTGTLGRGSGSPLASG